MKLNIDTEKKEIQILEKVSLKELKEFVEKLSLEEYSVVSIENVTNYPITYSIPNQTSPYPMPWENPHTITF